MNTTVNKKYKRFDIVNLKDGTTAEIRQFYPKHHSYANDTEPFYMVKFSDSGDDVISESRLLSMIK